MKKNDFITAVHTSHITHSCSTYLRNVHLYTLCLYNFSLSLSTHKIKRDPKKGIRVQENFSKGGRVRI